MKAQQVEVKAEQAPHSTPPSSSQQQQQSSPPYPPLPDYTSPPTETALLATPPVYRSDAVIAHARALAAAGACRAGDPEQQQCQMVFDVSDSTSSSSNSSSNSSSSSNRNHSRIGIVYYGGALIDPRAYAPTAQQLVRRYGLPVVVPIFAADLAFQAGQCQTHRLELAQAALPHVQKWIVVGHSFGGIAAMTDVYSLLQQQEEKNQPATTTTSSLASSSPTLSFDRIGGLVMIASYIRHDIGCGTIDFSHTQLPMAMVTASLDTRVNQTRWEWGLPFLSPQTFFVDILGGNHVQFASYDDTHRATILQQTPEPPATISPAAQLESTLAAIYNVAARAGVPLPEPPVPTTVMAMAPDKEEEEAEVAIVAGTSSSSSSSHETRRHRSHANQASTADSTGSNQPQQEQKQPPHWHLHHPNQKVVTTAEAVLEGVPPRSSSPWNLLLTVNDHVRLKQRLQDASSRNATASIAATSMMIMMLLAVAWVQRRRCRRDQPHSASSSFQ